MNKLYDELNRRILHVNESGFEALALDVFQYQYQWNPIYQAYVNNLGLNAAAISNLESIPCLPIQFFKKEIIKTGTWASQRVFKSSGTTGSVRSQHALKSLDWYHSISRRAFEQVYGAIEGYCFLALLPSYLERSDASLVEMTKYFISCSRYQQSGFYLNQFDALIAQVKSNQEAGIPTVLLGVTFALLELAEQYAPELKDIIIMETGGMKGQRKEWTKQELHDFLKKAFNVDAIHSEYGMTELTSQCYSLQNGEFKESPTMKIRIKEVSDPFYDIGVGKAGVINVIDLGNLDTCAFIETQDLGRRLSSLSFELLGRLDHSDIRGCNLMVV